ncbi:MAG: sulfate adenylyltransferase subunit 1 [Bacteroidia bacterium]
MNILRFTTAGSVDDGKSTLIGRLLYDSKSIFDDQYEAVKASSEKRGEEYVNLALLTDGLRAEREQGITIDVAYRYFATPQRKFIIADTPGHIQYTRNMVTGASSAQLAVILIDARKGLSEQTRRHVCIASLLRIPHLAVCINKMDLVNYDERVYNELVAAFNQLIALLEFQAVHFLPISALHGDHVVERSANMNWYQGKTLLELLETIEVKEELTEARFPVQYVIRPMAAEYHDYRGYAGRVAGGAFAVGDVVAVLPSGQQSKIKTIDFFGTSLDRCTHGDSVTLLLEDDVAVSRGDMLVLANQMPQVSQDIEAVFCWMNETSLVPNGKYSLRHTSRETRCVIKEIVSKTNIETLEQEPVRDQVRINELVRLRLRALQPLAFDAYQHNRITGSLILIDEATNETVAAGMIV